MRLPGQPRAAPPGASSRAWRAEIASRLGASRGGAVGEVVTAVALWCEAAGPSRAWPDEELDRLIVQACCAVGEREAAAGLLARRYPGRAARNARWLDAASTLGGAPRLAALARSGLLAAAAPVTGRGGARAWRIDLARLADHTAGGWELAVWPALARLLDALAGWAGGEGGTLTVGLAGARVLARRWSGRRGAGERGVRAFREELRGFCRCRLARRTGRDVEVVHLDIAR